MPRRILSDTYVDRQIAKVDEIFEKTNQNFVATPDILMPETEYSVFERKRISDWEREKIKAYYKQFSDLSFVRGFWQGWTLREGSKDERDDLIKALMEVARSAYCVPEFDCIFDNYPKQFYKGLQKRLTELKEMGVDLTSRPTV